MNLYFTLRLQADGDKTKKLNAPSVVRALYKPLSSIRLFSSSDDCSSSNYIQIMLNQGTLCSVYCKKTAVLEYSTCLRVI